MKTGKRLLMACAIAALATSAQAASPARTGTSGAMHLLIPTDARGVAMGGAVMAQSMGTRSWFWNPAGAAEIDANEITVAHHGYIADIGLNQFSYARNAGNIGVIGLSAKILSSGDEPVYTNSEPHGTGEFWSASFVVVGFSYARSLTDRVSFGLNTHYIAEELSREMAQGVAFDFGFIYRPAIRGLHLGVAVKNYGPQMKYDGPDLELPRDSEDPSSDHSISTKSAGFELPSFIQFGFAWDAWGDARQNVQLAGTFQANNFSDDELRVGAEWNYSEQFALRAGYAGSSQEAYLFGFTAGAGLRVPIGETMTTIDYAWRDAGVFGDNHLFTLSLAF